MKVTKNKSLSPHNTFHIDIKTQYFIEISDIHDIIDFVKSDLHDIQPRMILGGGSNILFTRDFNGCVIHPSIKGIEVLSENEVTVTIRAGAGENWDDFVGYCVENGWSGVENLSFIPGTVGASPIQNIGAYGIEVKDSVITVETIDLESGKTKKYSNKQCRFSYRNSIFKSESQNRVMITHVTFQLRKDHRFTTSYHDLNKELDQYPKTSLKNIRSAIIAIRKKKLPDPDTLANAGSFFQNPVVNSTKLDSLKLSYPDIPHFKDDDGNIKLSAAWLIEYCGWKGRRIKKAGTYKNQPLVIVNYGGATGREILNLARKIQHSVMNHFDIRLEPEVSVV